MVNTCRIICNTAKKGHKQSKQKGFPRISRGCRDGRGKKVTKQGKGSKGSYHCPMCHKQVPPSHITSPHEAPKLQAIAATYMYVRMVMWDGGTCWWHMHGRWDVVGKKSKQTIIIKENFVKV